MTPSSSGSNSPTGRRTLPLEYVARTVPQSSASSESRCYDETITVLMCLGWKTTPGRKTAVVAETVEHGRKMHNMVLDEVTTCSPWRSPGATRRRVRKAEAWIAIRFNGTIRSLGPGQGRRLGGRRRPLRSTIQALGGRSSNACVARSVGSEFASSIMPQEAAASRSSVSKAMMSASHLAVGARMRTSRPAVGRDRGWARSSSRGRRPQYESFGAHACGNSFACVRYVSTGYPEPPQH